MVSDDVKRQIEDFVTAIGATGEFLGAMRKTLMENGFTREEACSMCSNLLVSIIKNDKGEKHD